jgi:solute carrier family 25 phosphate transporter 23/24/25/41
VVPYVGLNFGVYETLKHMLLLHYGMRDERELSVGMRLGCGAIAGTTGQTVAYPFDVARRRLQVRTAWSRASVCVSLSLPLSLSLPPSLSVCVWRSASCSV